MKSTIVLAAAALALAGCTTYSVNSAGLEPIPGSITYGGQPRSRLMKAPIGSTVPHEFRNQWGERVSETYIIQPDRSLKLVERHKIPEPIWD
ncbi:hypothetical protein SAMN03159496_04731 [Rhizobium sp. NFR07]|uniref:hypothetical protein n=1 Tax=Rhizobium sp. NFR07 TaxID=1566262 RepID=UPI0008E26F3C|nr:hypothetical protein [Rhizobium sp. NFR07]SFB52998.1 hypothetical protein SAMN03159496_04731 [Rhizobium sp. NFR07]